ncbi:MAG: Xaa-Pro peptidase family protein [Candidatus Azobacteroides sp.]|nr:Xaa-Pro peptidase family protein [Candidatus Azobacteroides sp.]
MTPKTYPPLEDLQIRWKKVQKALKESGADACLVANNVNIYYLTGKIFAGFVYFPVEGDPIYFVQRPVDKEESYTIRIRKPEDIPDCLKERKRELPSVLFLEAGQLTYNEFLRLQAVFHPAATGDLTPLLRNARMIKTPWEIGQLRISAQQHVKVYEKIPSVFRENMRDIEFQYEIERLMRQNGSLGLFRTYGSNMDVFMGSVLAGKNAGMPSPYDFALGGAGLHACLPIGASGETIRSGQTVMVDMAGNFTAYMSDMSRVYSLGTLPDAAYEAHQLSIQMHNRLMETGKAGVPCADIYQWSLKMAEEAGWGTHFMGTVQQAKFVGHGIGLEINEPPVLTARSKEVLRVGMVIAYEPKFVFPEVGAVGIENTFLVTAEGMKKLTILKEDIQELMS